MWGARLCRAGTAQIIYTAREFRIAMVTLFELG
jgi:hypothetical protein